jgi:hypothetical protein
VNVIRGQARHAGELSPHSLDESTEFPEIVSSWPGWSGVAIKLTIELDHNSMPVGLPESDCLS